MHTKSAQTLSKHGRVRFAVKHPHRPGRIKLLSEIAPRLYGRQIKYDPSRNNRLPFNTMEVGDHVFMAGYTTNQRKQPSLRKINMTPYNQNGSKVWTVRSAHQDGQAGVMVWRVA